MKFSVFRFLSSFLLVLMALSGCKKANELPAPIVDDLQPTILLWPIPDNHPITGDSITIRVLSSNCDSVRINGKLQRLADIPTGPVLLPQRYLAEAFGKGVVVRDSITIYPVEGVNVE